MHLDEATGTKMMKRFLRCIIGLLFYVGSLSAQSTHDVVLKFNPVYHTVPVAFSDTYYPVGAKDSIRFDALRFYISQVTLLQKGEVVWLEPSSYHLVDVAEPASMQLHFSLPDNIVYDGLRFAVGIDSATNVAGAMGGDLDPTKGMYWTWQSGYINVKVEGVSSLSAARKHEFQYHLGGYMAPFALLQTVTLKHVQGAAMQVEIDLAQFIQGAAMDASDHVMTPSAEAVRLAVKFAEAFRLKSK